LLTCAYQFAQLSYITQSSCGYLPSYPPEKHQSSDAVYWREGNYEKCSKINWGPH